METHVLGFPRIGANRELKKALEAYWKGRLSAARLQAAADELKLRHWDIQRQAGLSLAAVGDFSFYDHVLDTIAMLGLVPNRFAPLSPDIGMKRYFQMARGDAARHLAPMEITKWFDTQYHCIVPELSAHSTIRLGSTKIVEETRTAMQLGFSTKPVLLGPITFLSLAKTIDGTNQWSLLPEVLAVYQQVLSALPDECRWVQIDEPALCTDLEPEALHAFPQVMEQLKKCGGGKKLLLATYFGPMGNNLRLALASGFDGVHLDLVRGGEDLEALLGQIPSSMAISAGIVDGRNIWKLRLKTALPLLERIQRKVGANRLMLASSCSLMHVPVDLEMEKDLDPTVRSWMAFAVQKCQELSLLQKILEGEDHSQALRWNKEVFRARRAHPQACRKEVRQLVAECLARPLSRASAHPIRKKAQTKKLQLPLFPTTTIGSFPQTAGFRAARRLHEKGQLPKETYETYLKEEIRYAIKQQELLGLNVLVHGEAERNDMVEYFGQRLQGFCFTRHGWVQSHGSRCVKPPIIYGDISRRQPITVPWITYAQSLTSRPVKGMLTGPVTILLWSFVRDDLSPADVCRQIACALREEVLELERAGIRIIQIDEAAFREGVPLRKARRAAYLRWAVEAFRLCVADVRDETQIHTHMCYNDSKSIIRAISALEADVISIECSRSQMALLQAFNGFEYPNDIGPGVYDIHSHRVPSANEILASLKKALQVIPKERLWVNPDCGLKNREYPETLDSLAHMVEAAWRLRREESKDAGHAPGKLSRQRTGACIADWTPQAGRQ